MLQHTSVLSGQCAHPAALNSRQCARPQRLRARCAAVVATETATAPAVAHRVLPAPKDAHFEENRTIFVEEFRIRGNEAGPDQRANIITMANLLQVGRSGEIGGAQNLQRPHPCMLSIIGPIVIIACVLQEIGGNHGVAMWGRSSSGFAAMPGMDHLIFVATRMQIRMKSYPSW